MKLTKEDNFNMRVAETLNSAYELYDITHGESNGFSYNFVKFAKDKLIPLYKGMKQRNSEGEQIYELGDVHELVHDYFCMKLENKRLKPQELVDLVENVLDEKAGMLSSKTIGDELEIDKRNLISFLFDSHYGTPILLDEIKELSKLQENVFAQAYEKIKKLNEIQDYMGTACTKEFGKINPFYEEDIDNFLFNQIKRLIPICDEEAIRAGLVPDYHRKELEEGILGKLFGKEGDFRKVLLFAGLRDKIDKCDEYAKNAIYPTQDLLHGDVMKSADNYVKLVMGNAPEADLEDAGKKLNADFMKYAEYSLTFGKVLEEDVETVNKLFVSIQERIEEAKKLPKFELSSLTDMKFCNTINHR